MTASTPGAAAIRRRLRASVIVPARNAASTIAECLLALRLQSTPREEFEVIVVDDGSTDLTGEVAERFWARVIRSPGLGPAAARNRGVAASRGEIILFTDADCAPDREWMRELLDAFEDPRVMAAKGTYRSEQTELTAKWIQAEYEDRYRLVDGDGCIDFVDTYSAAYRREAFEALGGFDESFREPSVEDQELGFRLARTGARMVFRPLAVVKHRHADTPRKYAKKKWRIGHHKMRVLRSHPDRAVADTHTPVVLKLQVVLAGLFAAALLGTPLGLVGAAWPIGFATAFLALEGPYAVSLVPKNGWLALAAPFFSGLRALALATGMCSGSVALLRSRRTVAGSFAPPRTRTLEEAGAAVLEHDAAP